MIDGVIIKDLKTHEDERGFFREIFRFSEEYNDVSVGQLSHSLVNKGVIKGWHGHKVQSQWNYVVTGLIKVALYDNRAASSTYKGTMEFFVGDGHEPCAYFFPPGVLHCYKCLKDPMHIIYVTSGVYDLSDEIRIALDDLEIRFN
jgi:dTDP-4-dehydrorhamnose 3,5-epimerase